MTASATKYRADIDGLRAIAVGAVLVYHAFPAVLKGGFTGVDVFFVISGYLISGIILDGVAGGRFTFAHFYARRIRRIFPALTVTLAAVMAAGWFWLYADDYARLSRHTAAGAAFVANIVLWRESSYFDVAADLKPLLHLWSLGIEEQFYLVWPLLLVAASRWRRGPIAVTLAIGAVSFALAIATVRVDRTAAFFAPWTRFWELLAGALLVAIERDAGFGARLQQLQMRAPIRGLQSVLGLVMVAAGMLLIDSTRVFPGLWALLPAAGTVLLILAGADAPVNRTLLSWRPMVWIGLISYPLYLWHWPLLSFAYILLGEVPPPALAIALLVLSVALARATYLLIERPIRFGTPSRIAIPGLAIAMTAICAFAAVVAVSGGMIDRAVNRNDAAHLVNYYARMRQSQIAAAYRRECDFMEWQTERTRDEIDRSCTVAGQAHTIFLWGDSFAQSLSLGLRESAPPGTSVAQVATSACRAAVDDFDLAVKDRRCEKANRYALEAIRRLRPDIVVIAQQNRHDRTDWEKLIAAVIELGAAHVVVVGPLPAWPQGLPSIYADRHMTDHADYLADGLEPALFDVDRRLAARLAGRGDATYLSVLEQLCRDGACLARVPGADPLDLMALDFGHLTPKGSSYLGRVLWKPYLERAIK
jgi:peptidoglycan/LPS O-acetylase OafA/YrhL